MLKLNLFGGGILSFFVVSKPVILLFQAGIIGSGHHVLAFSVFLFVGRGGASA
jgi:hypothetical protein